jgi:glycosyltransferase involved in cell wall biosynthesis
MHSIKELSLAKADYIARFDADDICMPSRLAQQINFLLHNPNYVAVGSDATYIDAGSHFLFNFSCIGHEDEAIKKKLFFYCPFIHSAVMYKKEPVLAVGGYHPDAHNFEDYFLWVALSQKGKFHNLAVPLIQVRFHAASVTIDEKWRGSKFRKIKRAVLQSGTINKIQGDTLLKIIQRQSTEKIKQGSYHALCGKKYLLDNHQPKLARKQLAKAIAFYPAKWDNYALYLLSFFPYSFIYWLHRNSPNKI